MPMQDKIMFDDQQPSKIADVRQLRPQTDMASEPRRSLWGLLVGGGLIIAILAGVAFTFSHRAKPATKEATPQILKGSESAKESTPRVTILTTVMTPIVSRVSITGTLAARNDMPVGPEGEGGRIQSLHADAGDHVRRGQVLAHLNTDLLVQQVAELAAQRDEAIANAAVAAADYARGQSVAAQGFLTQQELDKRRAATLSADSKTKVITAQLQQARVRLARADIRAPADGVVMSRAAEIGQMAVAGGEPLFHVAGGGQIELKGQVAEQDLPALRIGQPATIRLTGIDRDFPGTIWQMAPTIDSRSRLGAVRIALTPHPLLRPGAFAHADIVAGKGQHILLPQSAVQNDTGQSYVLIVGKDDRLEKRPVKVAQTTSEGVVIAEGLNVGERLVASAGAFLHVGEKIIPETSKG